MDVPKDVPWPEVRKIIRDEFPNHEYQLQGPREYIEDGLGMLQWTVVLQEQCIAHTRILCRRLNSRVASKTDPSKYLEWLRREHCLQAIPEGGSAGSAEDGGRQLPPRDLLRNQTRDTEQDSEDESHSDT